MYFSVWFSPDLSQDRPLLFRDENEKSALGCWRFGLERAKGNMKTLDWLFVKVVSGLSQGFRVAGSVPKVGGCRENLAASRQGTMRFAHRSGRVWEGGGPPPIGGVWGASPRKILKK